MEVSTKGMIEIMSHEAIILEPYLDSVGVWTIGVGQTKSDDIDPRAMGKLTVQQAVDLFKRKIKSYDRAVSNLGLNLTQYQHDALTSCCYNFGEGNLRTLCHGRTLAQIGGAIMLYTKPPEITARRQKEQALFLTGKYSNIDGRVLVAPVNANHHPVYAKGYMLDVRPYFGATAAPAPTPALKPAAPKPQPAPTKTATKAGGAVVIGGAAATVAHQAGVDPIIIVAVVAAVALAAFLIWKLRGK